MREEIKKTFFLQKNKEEETFVSLISSKKKSVDEYKVKNRMEIIDEGRYTFRRKP